MDDFGSHSCGSFFGCVVCGGGGGGGGVESGVVLLSSGVGLVSATGATTFFTVTPTAAFVSDPLTNPLHEM